MDIATTSTVAKVTARTPPNGDYVGKVLAWTSLDDAEKHHAVDPARSIFSSFILS